MTQPNGHILVVDDDREMNEMVGAYAQLAGYDYRSALDGGTAVRMATARVPALVLLDVMLPDLDGFEVARRLRGEESTRDVPIVMLTALDRDEYRQQGRLAGAVDYIVKPFDPDRLIEAIRSNARRRA